MSNRCNNPVGGVAAPRLVRLGLLSLRFVTMGKTLYVVVQVAGWNYSWKLGEDTINDIRRMVGDDLSGRPPRELLVREGLGYARVETDKQYLPRPSELQNQVPCHQSS